MTNKSIGPDRGDSGTMGGDRGRGLERPEELDRDRGMDRDLDEDREQEEVRDRQVERGHGGGSESGEGGAIR